MDTPTRGTLSQVAYEEIQKRIIRSVMPPGLWVTEKGLAEELGLTLSPVRVALTRLTNEGLLISSPRRGYRVSSLTLKFVDDLFETWKLLACEIMRLAALNMTPEAMTAHAGLIERSKTRVPKAGQDEIDLWLITANEQWHFFARLANNECLEDIYLRLESQLARVFSLTFSSSLGVGFSDRHARMDRMLRARDAEGVGKETLRVLERIHREARRSLTEAWAPSAIHIAI